MLKIKILYEPGRKNSLADALSRIKRQNEGINKTIHNLINIEPGQMEENKNKNIKQDLKDNIDIKSKI